VTMSDEGAKAEIPEDEADFIGGSMSNELSANRTAMSFERTAMSAHRTLHAVMKTSLSLIGFGFTIFKFFTALSSEYIGGQFPQHAARNFGMALVFLGIAILFVGMAEHYQTMSHLRERKRRLFELGLVHSVMELKVVSSMVLALLLLLIGIAALLNILFRIGPA